MTESFYKNFIKMDKMDIRPYRVDDVLLLEVEGPYMIQPPDTTKFFAIYKQEGNYKV